MKGVWTCTTPDEAWRLTRRLANELLRGSLTRNSRRLKQIGYGDEHNELTKKISDGRAQFIGYLYVLAERMRNNHREDCVALLALARSVAMDDVGKPDILQDILGQYPQLI
jgi:hypothetical protein